MKKLLLILGIAGGNVYALDAQLNVSTLGYGIGLSIPITERWSITGAVDAVNYSQILADTKVISTNPRYTQYTENVVEYSSNVSLNNISFGLGAEYLLLNTKDVKISAEGGLKYNYLSGNYKDNLYVNEWTAPGSHQVSNTSISTATIGYNTIAPYAQVNVKYFLNKEIYVAGQLGLEYANLHVVNNSSNANLLNVPLMPIAGLGIGYSF